MHNRAIEEMQETRIGHAIMKMQYCVCAQEGKFVQTFDVLILTTQIRVELCSASFSFYHPVSSKHNYIVHSMLAGTIQCSSRAIADSMATLVSYHLNSACSAPGLFSVARCPYRPALPWRPGAFFPSNHEPNRQVASVVGSLTPFPLSPAQPCSDTDLTLSKDSPGLWLARGACAKQGSDKSQRR